MHMFVLDHNENVYDIVGYINNNLKNIGLIYLNFLYMK